MTCPVVDFSGDDAYVIFFEEDDVHEDVTLPDDTIAFRRPTEGCETRIRVTRDMLPAL